MHGAMAIKQKLPRGAKATFVRANPNATVADLVKLAKKQGITLTAGHVYNIRAEEKKKGQSATNGRAAPSLAQGSTSRSDGPQLDAQLRTLVIRMGLDRAERIFSELKASLSRMA
jgi:hypothetical protein